jgi:hypothetical protein
MDAMPLTTQLKTMTIADILAQYPQTKLVFQQFGLDGYAKTETAKYENLEAGALVHAIDLNALLNALTGVIEG